MQREPDREALAKSLLSDTAPDELEFFGEYVKAFDHEGSSGRFGPEWGIAKTAGVGPTVVTIGLFLFEILKSWTVDVPKKIVEGFIVDGGKAQLKAWLGSPKKGDIAPMVTAKGRAEVMAVVAGLIVRSKLSPREAEQITKRVAGYLFGNDANHK